MTTDTQRQSMHWLKKFSYMVAVVVCLVLGLIGLVLPIIPGLVFLFLAVLLLTKVSMRVDSLARAHAGFRRTRQHWHRLHLLPAGDRVRLGMWYAAGALISGVERGVRFIQQKLRSGTTNL